MNIKLQRKIRNFMAELCCRCYRTVFEIIGLISIMDFNSLRARDKKSCSINFVDRWRCCDKNGRRPIMKQSEDSIDDSLIDVDVDFK